MQYLGTYLYLKRFIAYLKFKFNLVSCILSANSNSARQREIRALEKVLECTDARDTRRENWLDLVTS